MRIDNERGEGIYKNLGLNDTRTDTDDEQRSNQPRVGKRSLPLFGCLAVLRPFGES